MKQYFKEREIAMNGWKQGFEEGVALMKKLYNAEIRKVLEEDEMRSVIGYPEDRP